MITEIDESEIEPTDEEAAAREFYDQNAPAPRNEFHDAALTRLDDFFFKGLRMLLNYDGDKMMALDCYALAHGQGEMIQVPVTANPKGRAVDAVIVAVKHFGDAKKKAAVTKCVKKFQDCLGIPPMPGQRGESGRKSMADARKSQLKK